MSLIRTRIRYIILVAVALVAACLTRSAHGADVTRNSRIRLQHSVDGRVWKDAMDVAVGNGHSRGGLDVRMVDGSVYGRALGELLAGASTATSRYYLRAHEDTSDGSDDGRNDRVPAFGSIPLSCWMTAGRDALVEVTVSRDGGVKGVSLMAPCEEGRENVHMDVDGAGGAGGVDGGAATGTKARAQAVVDGVVVVWPEVVVTREVPVGGDIRMDVDDGTASGKATVKGSGGKQNMSKKGGEEKDERSWLQKNWLFVALAFFILANKLGEAGGTNPGGAQGGARGPARR